MELVRKYIFYPLCLTISKDVFLFLNTAIFFHKLIAIQ